MTPCTKMGHGRLSTLSGWRGKGEMRSVGDREGGSGEEALSVAQAPFPHNVDTGGGEARMGPFEKNNVSPLLPSCSSCSFLPEGTRVEIWSS